MAKGKQDKLYKVMLIGDSGVGKTSIIFRFAENAFSTTFISTIGIDFKMKTLEVKGRRVKLQIWDTAGQERFHTITTSFYRGARGIILVYDITNTKSFDNITNWLRNIEKHAHEDVEKMILGNKADVEEKRMVKKGRGEEMAEEHGVPFFETSAKTDMNIEAAFVKMVEQIMDKDKEETLGLPQVVLSQPTQKEGCLGCSK